MLGRPPWLLSFLLEITHSRGSPFRLPHITFDLLFITINAHCDLCIAPLHHLAHALNQDAHSEPRISILNRGLLADHGIAHRARLLQDQPRSHDFFISRLLPAITLGDLPGPTLF